MTRPWRPYPGARVLSVYRLATGDTEREATGTVTGYAGPGEVYVVFRGRRWRKDTFTRWLRPAPGWRPVRARRGRR